MKTPFFARSISLTLILTLSFAAVFAQRRAAAPKPIVFAVLNGGTTIEPIALIDAGELKYAFDAATDEAELIKFTRSYYKPKTVYRLVFGGADAGSVTVKSNDPKAECSKHTAEVTVASTRAKLGGLVMGLATSGAVKKGAGTRRRPTAPERSEIEALVRAEFAKNKVGAAAAKNLKSRNLTALDVDADGAAEMIGSYWVDTSATSRGLLFFIAEKGRDGKYRFGHSEYRAVKQEDTMSGEIKSIDEGVYQEVLLDAMEYDGDTTAEIFTYTPSFEGAGFNAYSRREGKWVRAFEDSNYHCGY
jgi:hypothetical protein